MRQLRLMKLMIQHEEAFVSIDVTTRTELVGLMARMLVVDFHATGRSGDNRADLQSQD